MKVLIKNYRVIPAADHVDIDLEVQLPTGNVNVTIPAVESALQDLATTAAKTTWDEVEMIHLVGGFFNTLAGLVEVDKP